MFKFFVIFIILVMSDYAESSCEQLGKVRNSKNMTWNDGNLVNFTCSPGYNLVGSAILYCNGTKWNSTVPKCISKFSEGDTLTAIIILVLVVCSSCLSVVAYERFRDYRRRGDFHNSEARARLIIM